MFYDERAYDKSESGISANYGHLLFQNLKIIFICR